MESENNTVEGRLDIIIKLLEKQNSILQGLSSVSHSVAGSSELTAPNMPDVKNMIAKARQEAQAKMHQDSMNRAMPSF